MGKNTHIWRQITKIAAQQHGNINRQDLLAVGLGHDGIYYAVKAGRLHRVFRGVYAVGRRPTTPIERAAAAVMACGSRAALSHGSAMTLWGFWQRWGEPFEVIVVIDRRPMGIRIHRSSTLLRRDVTHIQGIQVTSAARTLLDMAPRISPKSLTRRINDSRRSSLLTLDDLADVAARNATHSGAPLLRAHLDSPHNPTRSGFEDDFVAFCERYALPTPLINADVHDFEVDAYFPIEKVIVEVDGWPYHRYRSSFEDDRERDATMLLHEIVTVRITEKRLEHSPAKEAERLHEILRSRRSP